MPMHAYDYDNEFRAVSYPLRLYSGEDALENLPAELKRLGARRAFIVCGRTVSRRFDLVQRIRTILGPNDAGVFDEMDKDTSLDSVLRATAAAKAAQADLIVAVGAGSVIQGARVVAILLAETAPIESLITQYPEHGAAISPKLMAPKLPIVNGLTAATSAQNRAGSAVKDPARGRRMEFFDPKTRPIAIFWDSQALMTAPVPLVRTTCASVYWRSVSVMGSPSRSPLCDGDRIQAYRLAQYALSRVGDTQDPSPRVAACTAAFLQNREADDGGGPLTSHWVSRVVYAFSTGIFNLNEQIGQGEASTALAPTVIRALGPRDPVAMSRIAETLGVWRAGDAVDLAPQRAAAELERVFAAAGLPTRVSQLGISKDGLPAVVAHSLRNFNADPRREFLKEEAMLSQLLRDCW